MFALVAARRVPQLALRCYQQQQTSGLHTVPILYQTISQPRSLSSEFCERSRRNFCILLLLLLGSSVVGQPQIATCQVVAAEPHTQHFHRPRAVHSMAATSNTGAVVVYVTVPNQETASQLSSKLVEGKLAACVNILPGVQSVYWWEGKVQTDNELLLIMKTQQALLGELTTAVKENHPYDEPEVISLPITGGSEGYLKWIRNSTKGSES